MDFKDKLEGISKVTEYTENSLGIPKVNEYDNNLSEHKKTKEKPMETSKVKVLKRTECEENKTGSLEIPKATDCVDSVPEIPGSNINTLQISTYDKIWKDGENYEGLQSTPTCTVTQYAGMTNTTDLIYDSDYEEIDDDDYEEVIDGTSKITNYQPTPCGVSKVTGYEGKSEDIQTAYQNWPKHGCEEVPDGTSQITHYEQKPLGVSNVTEYGCIEEIEGEWTELEDSYSGPVDRPSSETGKQDFKGKKPEGVQVKSISFCF